VLRSKLTELKELEETLIPFEIMDDGRADMNQISRSVHAALEYYRVGDEGGVNATTDEIALGKGIIQCSMQPFALECAIKGLLQALESSFPTKHNLSILLNKLPPENQEEIQTNWAKWNLAEETQKMTFRKFVEEHKNDFVQWRYLAGQRLESTYLTWFAAIEAVNMTTGSLLAQRKPLADGA
jgi:hypothetical protein